MPIPELHGRQVLVTGAAGFIGSHLVDSLLENGARIRALDNFSNGRRENLAHCMDRIEFIEGDVRDLQTCVRACRDVSFLFHESALGSVPRSMADPATTFAVNVSGSANVFAAAKDAGVRRVIYASSSSVYGDSRTLPKREGEEGRPLSPYALSKRMNEELADVFSRCFGMELIGLRYFNVYGPRQDPDGPYAAVLPRFFKSSLAGEAPVIHGDGEQSRDFTFVLDAVRSNLLAAGAPAAACGRAYNVAGGRRTTVNDLAEAVRRVVGGGPAPVHQADRPGDVKHSLADVSLARDALGFSAEVDLEGGIAKTAPYYLSAKLWAQSGAAASNSDDVGGGA
ncbi:MAG: SDR family oxidoreductase [Acidobacteriota bacterium]|nr:SDR family oxidoreductase [Acidobacteriota bacterium]